MTIIGKISRHQRRLQREITSKHHVYGLIDDEGFLFYVGLSHNMKTRLSQHKARFRGVNDIRMIKIATFPNHKTAHAFEKAILRAIEESEWEEARIINDAHYSRRGRATKSIWDYLGAPRAATPISRYRSGSRSC